MISHSDFYKSPLKRGREKEKSIKTILMPDLLFFFFSPENINNSNCCGSAMGYKLYSPAPVLACLISALCVYMKGSRFCVLVKGDPNFPGRFSMVFPSMQNHSRHEQSLRRISLSCSCPILFWSPEAARCWCKAFATSCLPDLVALTHEYLWLAWRNKAIFWLCFESWLYGVRHCGACN